MLPLQPISTLFPYTTLFRSKFDDHLVREARNAARGLPPGGDSSKVRSGRVGDHFFELPEEVSEQLDAIWREEIEARDRKSTRLNSSHTVISYAVFCLKKKRR